MPKVPWLVSDMIPTAPLKMVSGQHLLSGVKVERLQKPWGQGQGGMEPLRPKRTVDSKATLLAHNRTARLGD